MTFVGKSRVPARVVVPALAVLLAASAVEGLPASASGSSGATAASALRGVSVSASSGLSAGTPATKRAPKALPTLRTRVVMGRLDVPWDVAVLPTGAYLVTERDRQRITLHTAQGGRRVISNGPPGIWSGGETGLMSILRDPRVTKNGRFYTCNGWRNSSGHRDIRVLAWRMNSSRTRAHVIDTLLSGIQITSGRHGGCRLRFGPGGALYVGTGDSAVGTNPQNLRSLNGKILRMTTSGRPWPGNPWIHSPNRKKRFVYNYGHRNVQGLARRPGGVMWSVEHGTDRDDEVNVVLRAGNYGWNPVPGYNENTPMTNYRLPGKQIGARWRSGFPTLATSGAVFVRGKKWGRYQGTLAVCALKASKLVFMRFDKSGHLVWTKVPPALNGRYGRLRSVVMSKGNDLLITTANGGGADKIVRVSPH